MTIAYECGRPALRSVRAAVASLNSEDIELSDDDKKEITHA